MLRAPRFDTIELIKDIFMQKLVYINESGCKFSVRITDDGGKSAQGCG